MPEQLKASAAIMGAGLKNVALVTDGRYSGARYAHPFTRYLPLTDNRLVMDLSSDSKLILYRLAAYAQIFLPIFPHARPRKNGHTNSTSSVVPEAAVGGPIGLVKNGDVVTISAENNTLSMDVSPEEIEQRRQAWKPPKSVVNRGVLAKYSRLVGDASHGAMTDLF
jgi:dihydroxy-acid dehydratase